MGAGTLALPTVSFGVLAYGRRTLPRWARVLYGALAPCQRCSSCSVLPVTTDGAKALSPRRSTSAFVPGWSPCCPSASKASPRSTPSQCRPTKPTTTTPQHPRTSTRATRGSLPGRGPGGSHVGRERLGRPTRQTEEVQIAWFAIDACLPQLPGVVHDPGRVVSRGWAAGLEPWPFTRWAGCVRRTSTGIDGSALAVIASAAEGVAAGAVAGGLDGAHAGGSWRDQEVNAGRGW